MKYPESLRRPDEAVLKAVANMSENQNRASRPPQAAARDAGSRSGGTPKALGARSRCQWKRLLPLQGQEGPGLWKLSSRPWQSKWHWCRGWIWYSGSI